MYYSIYPTRIKDATVLGHLFPPTGQTKATTRPGAQGELKEVVESQEAVTPPTPLPWPFPTSWLADRRDEAFLQYVTILSATILPSAFWLLFAPARHVHVAHAIVHALFTVYNIRKYLLMLHCTSHRRLFRKEWGLLNHWVPMVGWFTGQTINSYYVHHCKMHHIANNGPKDASSTLPYQRDNFLHFLHYFFRFYFFGIFDLVHYFYSTRQPYYLALVAIGEPVTLATYAYFCYTRPLAATAVFLVPFNFTRFGMMMGNFTQHAFLDHADPTDNYKNSITCVEDAYNDFCFNDGYHASHHANPLRHWSDHPGQLYDARETYAQAGSIIFKRADYEWIFIRLMLQDYRSLAQRVVWMGKEGPDYPLTHTETVMDWLRAKTKAFTPAEIDKIYPPVAREDAADAGPKLRASPRKKSS